MLPFPGGPIEALNAALLLSGVAAILYGFQLHHPPHLLRTAVKALPAVLLAVIALRVGAPHLLVTGLFLSAAGDAALAHDGERAFMGGLASFLLAHLAYIALFAGSGGPFLLPREPWRGLLMVLVAGHAIPMGIRLWRAVPRALRLPVACYVAAILAMGLAAIAFGNLLLIAGAVLFIVSDTLLATERFLMKPGSPHLAWIAPAVWATYYAAQIFITLSYAVAG